VKSTCSDDFGRIIGNGTRSGFPLVWFIFASFQQGVSQVYGRNFHGISDSEFWIKREKKIPHLETPI
jgi:hypothetical protein